MPSPTVAFPLRLLLCCLLVHPWGGANAEVPPSRSVSTSRQFIVYGEEMRLRGAMAEAGERTKKALLDLLQTPDHWETPIVISLRHPRANMAPQAPASLQVSQTGFGLKLQLELLIEREIDVRAIERELLRAVLLERMYRGGPLAAVGSRYAQPPDWLLTGVLASAETRHSSALPAALAVVATAERTLPLAEFLRQKPELLDGPSAQLYRAYALVLVTELTKTAPARAALAQFIAALPGASADPEQALRAAFPGLFASPAGEGPAWWPAAVQRMAASRQFQPLTMAQSEARLAPLLRVQFPGEEKSFALDQFERFVARPGRTRLLREHRQALMGLAVRANPLYQPLVAEYQAIVDRLAGGKTGGMAKRIAAAEKMRKQLSAQAEAMDDYLNWFEATRLESASGNFRGYLKAAAERDELVAPRRDAISNYLSAMETQVR